MRSHLLLSIGLILLGSLGACSPASPTPVAYHPSFFYLAFSPAATLIISDKPGDTPRSSMALDPPTDCSLYSMHPAPVGPWIAVEWECSFGPAVELFDTSSAKSHFALSDPTIDSRFLAWQPDGTSIYLKIGTLSVPQTLRVETATGQAIELPISPFAYDLAGSPDGKKILYSLTKGIGFGSETWLAGPAGQNPSQLLLDAKNITSLAQFSPDGKNIAYIKFADNQAVAPPGELWLVDANGFQPRKLADADAAQGFAPAWSPDGTKIAFIGRVQPAEGSGPANLSIYNLSNGELISVKASPATQPTWSPDGRFVTYSSAGQVGSAVVPSLSVKMNVWFYEISSGQTIKLLNEACCAGWIR